MHVGPADTSVERSSRSRSPGTGIRHAADAGLNARNAAPITRIPIPIPACSWRRYCNISFPTMPRRPSGGMGDVAQWEMIYRRQLHRMNTRQMSVVARKAQCASLVPPGADVGRPSTPKTENTKNTYKNGERISLAHLHHAAGQK